MPYGFGAALTWALDTVILGIALANPAFAATPQAIALAAFTSTFLHDASSAVFSFAYMGIRRKLGKTWRTLRSKSGLVIVGAALIGGPIGTTGYVVAINNIGPAYTAAISAFFPAYGAALATVVLKERMRPYQWAGLAACRLRLPCWAGRPSMACLEAGPWASLALWSAFLAGAPRPW